MPWTCPRTVKCYFSPQFTLSSLLRVTTHLALMLWNCLVWNLILIILYHIVSSGSEVLVWVPYNTQHVSSRFLIIFGWHEPLLQQRNGLSTEARQSRVEHQRNKSNNCILVWSNGQERLNAQITEPFEGCCFHFSSHHHHHFVGQLEIWFETYVTARRRFEHEAKIWMKKYD